MKRSVADTPSGTRALREGKPGSTVAHATAPGTTAIYIARYIQLSEAVIEVMLDLAVVRLFLEKANAVIAKVTAGQP